jgi:uncharacterized protein (DUF983 family)
MKIFKYLRLWYRANFKGICPRCNGKTYSLYSEFEMCSKCTWDEYKDDYWGEIK